MTGRKLATICRVLALNRASAYRAPKPWGPRYARADDRLVLAQIREVIRTRATYGARRIRALVNRTFGTGYNLKRIRRVMELAGWKLPRAARRRTGRAHTGQIQRPGSNERWCSDVLEIACWNGEYVPVGFALDCHDWGSQHLLGLPRCQSLAESIGTTMTFRRLGAGQLVKHVLGLATTSEDRPVRLAYLWYDCGCDEAKEHQAEVEAFGEAVGSEIELTTLAYQELFQRLRLVPEPSHGYLAYLEARYFPM